MVQAIRQIIETRKLKGIIDIPESFSGKKVEILVLPVQQEAIRNDPFEPEKFFAVSHFNDIDQQLKTMRDEWER